MWPIHLNLGFKVVHYYEGFYIVVSLLAACLLVFHRLQKAALEARIFADSLIWILMGAVLGARISHYLFWDLKALVENPLSFFRIWEGGLSITGGLAGGVLAAFLCFRREKADFWHAFAIASPAVLIGQALGRVGCFLNGDAWGTPTRLPWGISLPKSGTTLPTMVRDGQVPGEAWLWSVRQGFTDPRSLITVPLHPTQLYEAFGDLLLAGLVVLMARNLDRAQGPWPKVFWVHLGGYSILRFALEFLHGDRDVTVWTGMTALQLGLLSFAILSGLAFARTGRRAKD
jgi:phosphatidylglycerol:prolipoprotein diacylglycerol transferase